MVVPLLRKDTDGKLRPPAYAKNYLPLKNPGFTTVTGWTALPDAALNKGFASWQGTATTTTFTDGAITQTFATSAAKAVYTISSSHSYTGSSYAGKPAFLRVHVHPAGSPSSGLYIFGTTPARKVISADAPNVAHHFTGTFGSRSVKTLRFVGRATPTQADRGRPLTFPGWTPRTHGARIARSY